MPVYNAERYVADATESILAQTHRDFEFIIINDGSTDDSLRILKKYAAADSRVRLLSRSNTGIVEALNEGLSLARGQFIARMDADDLCRRDRFELQLALMEQDPELVVLGSCALAIDPEGDALGHAPVPLSHDEIEARHLRGMSSIYHPAVMMRGEVLRKLGGYRSGTCPCEDFDLWLRMGEIGKLANMPEPLFVWRRTLSGIVATRSAEIKGTLQRIVADAWRRRKLPGNSTISNVDVVSGSDLCAQWGWQALRHGHVRTARKYAYKYLIAEPWRRNAWKLAACAMRGH